MRASALHAKNRVAAQRRKTSRLTAHGSRLRMGRQPLELLLGEGGHRLQLEELDLEVEVRAAGNRPDALRSVSQAGRHDDAPLLAHVHRLDRPIPARDHRPDADGEFEGARQPWWQRGAFGGVDLLAFEVANPERVVNDAGLATLGKR